MIIRRTDLQPVWGGLALLIASAIALIWDNSALSGSYKEIISQEWISAAAIFVFFISIGIELRDELRDGSLSSPKKAAVPILATVISMIIPALTFLFFNHDTTSASGWSIPISTDVAFALAVLALAGRFMPKPVRVFLLTVAVVDDALTILIIAIFYSASLHPLSFASMAGLLVGMVMPKGQSVLRRLNPVVYFGALPLFALVSVGIDLRPGSSGSIASELNSIFSSPLVVGILISMVLAKPLGVLFGAWIVVKTKIGKLPQGLKFSHLATIAPLFGICFTTALLMTDLAFGTEGITHTEANLSVFVGAIIAGLLGTISLRVMRRRIN